VINATIIGNPTRDPETRHVGDGTVTNFNIAVNRKVGTKEYVTFVGCSLWGKRGESFAQYHRKGDKAAVSGTLYNEDYQEKTYTKLDVNDWTFVKSGDSSSKPDSGRVVDSPLPKRGPSGADFGGHDKVAATRDFGEIPF